MGATSDYKTKIYILIPPPSFVREIAMENGGDRTADDQVAATTDESNIEKKSSGPPQFVPKLLKRSVLIRMMDGRSVKGVLEASNNYELLLDLGQGKKLIVFKGAISSIDYEDEPPKEKKEVKTWQSTS
mgnify:CR=1 FL=1